MAGQQRGPLACTSYSPCVREHHERFSKHELLGQGACKRVYRGFDEAEGIEVAWCEITANEGSAANEKERERVFGEIRLLSKLKHKNILALHDWWFDRPNNTLVFITELFMDGSLRSYRKRHRSVDTAVLKRWAWQILQGLVYLHGHNPPIIHRDLKSDNIFINGTSGVIKIGDLGFATFRAGFSTAMSVIGTPEFMAPELYEEQYTEKVDVYSFGMCLMELATMEYPYAECRNAAQIYRKVTSGIPPKGLDKVVDPELNAFVRLCIQPDPNQRPEARQLLKHPFFDAVRDCGRRATPPGASGLHSSTSSPNLLALTTSVPPPLLPPPPPDHPSQQSSPSPTNPGALTPTPQQQQQQQQQQSMPPSHSPQTSPSAPTPPLAAPPSPIPRSTSITLGFLEPSSPHPPPPATNTLGTPQQPSTAAAYVAPPPPPLQQQGGQGGGGGLRNRTQPPPVITTPLYDLTHYDKPASIAAAVAAGGQGGGARGPLKPGSPLPLAIATPRGSTHSPSPSPHPPPSPAAGTAPHPWLRTPPPQQQQPTPFSPSNSSSSRGGQGAADWLQGPLPHPPSPFGQVQHGEGVGRGTAGGGGRQGGDSPPADLADTLLFEDSPHKGASGPSPATSPGSAQRSPSHPPHGYWQGRGEEGQRGQEGREEAAEEEEEGIAILGVGSSHTAGGSESEEELLGDVLGSCGDSAARSALIRQRVRLACRSQHDNMLAFSMSFVNTRGTRKKVGFQYDMDADTANEVASEMVENLSLNVEEARLIADMIQDEIARCAAATTTTAPDTSNGTAQATCLQPATSNTSSSSSSGGGGGGSNTAAQSRPTHPPLVTAAPAQESSSSNSLTSTLSGQATQPVAVGQGAGWPGGEWWEGGHHVPELGYGAGRQGSEGGGGGGGRSQPFPHATTATITAASHSAEGWGFKSTSRSGSGSASGSGSGFGSMALGQGAVQAGLGRSGDALDRIEPAGSQGVGGGSLTGPPAMGRKSSCPHAPAIFSGFVVANGL